MSRIKTTPPLVGPDFSVPGKQAIYFLAFKEIPFVKIGKAMNWRDRCREHQCASPFHMEVLMLAPGSGNIESTAHTVFRDSRWRGEWFHYDANFKRRLKVVAAAHGDVEAVLNDEFARERQRIAYWATVSSMFYGISDLAIQFSGTPVRNRERGPYDKAAA